MKIRFHSILPRVDQRQETFGKQIRWFWGTVIVQSVNGNIWVYDTRAACVQCNDI